jgi:hypothetical protein
MWPIIEHPGWKAIELENGDTFAFRLVDPDRYLCTLHHRSFQQVLIDIEDIERHEPKDAWSLSP